MSANRSVKALVFHLPDEQIVLDYLSAEGRKLWEKDAYLDRIRYTVKGEELLMATYDLAVRNNDIYSAGVMSAIESAFGRNRIEGDLQVDLSNLKKSR